MRLLAPLLLAPLLLALAACDDAADRPATWSYVHAAILSPACTTAGCHGKLTAIAGVDLSDREGAYTVLVGRVCGEMPPDAPLPDVEVEIVERWIDDGAACD
jgi:hypothetical protein